MQIRSVHRKLAALFAAAAAVPALAGSPAATAGTPAWHASYSSRYVSPYAERCGVPCPGQDPGVLTSVVALSAKHALAAGLAYPNADADSNAVPVIKEWNGTRWTTWVHQPKTTQAHAYSILAIVGTSLTSVWTLTAPATYRYPALLVRHWNGHHWSTLNQTGLPYLWTGQLSLVHGTLTLTGTDGDQGGVFVARYGPGPHGERWYATHLARTGRFQSAAVTGGTLFAAGGTDPSGDGGSPLIFERTASGWHGTTVPAAGDGTVTAIAAAGSSDALAVGQGTAPFALRWDGRAWVNVAPPPSVVTVRTILAAGPGDYWASGAAAPGQTHTVYLHYVSGAWQTVVGPDRSNAKWGSQQFTEIQALAKTPHGSRLWAVGAHLPNGSECDDIDGCADESSGSLIIDGRF